MDQAAGFSTGRYRRSILAASLAAPLIFLAIAWPLILIGANKGRGAADSLNYHEKAIRSFAKQFPHPDLSDYLSATTPGYHLLVSVFARFISDKQIYLQLFSSLITAGLVITLASACAWRMRRAMSPFGVVAVCLPFLTSLYVVSSGVWLLPDNAAWWALLCVLLLALRRSQHVGVWFAAGILMIVLVLTRQIHIWAAALVWLAAWIGPGPARAEAPLFLRHDIGGLVFPRLARAAIAFVFTIPAFLVLWSFMKLWNGLTPPTFKQMHGASFQLATPAFDLSLLAIAGLFYISFWRHSLLKLLHEQSWIVAIAAGAGLLLGTLPETTEDPAEGRVSGIFHAVRALPTFFGHSSILIMSLSTLGAIVLVAWLRAINPRARWIMLAALIGFSIANTANPQLWQRYHEPFILLWTILASSLAVWSGGGGGGSGGGSALGAGRRPGIFAVLGPLVLAVFLGAISVRGIFYERVATDAGFTPGHVEPTLLAPQKPKSSK